MSRAAPGVLRRHREGLTAGQREDRAARKREKLNTAWLVPDVFVLEGEYCLPPLNVAVIGAGFAGLSAAWYLHQCGARTTVYEAQSRVGGRVLTDRQFISNKLVEAGAELIGENHPLWWRLAGQFGLRMTPLTGEDEYERRGLETRLRMNGHTLTKAELDKLETDLLPHLDRIGREAKPIVAERPWDSPNAKKTDKMTVKDKLDLMLGTGTGTSHVRQWFELVLGNDNCAPVSKQSYLGLLALVSAGRMGDDAAGLRGYWDSTETHRCTEGNQQLAVELGGALPDVRLGDPVTKVEVELDLIPPVRIWTRDGPERGESFDFVILAAPPKVWKDITFKPGFAAADRTIQDGPAVKYLTSYDNKFWEAAKLAPSAVWDELGSVWESTDGQPAGSSGFGLSVFSGGDHVLSGGATAYAAKLATFFPGGTVRRARLEDWTRAPRIMTGYSVPGRGEVTTIAPKLYEPHRQRLYFAGEQTCPGFFGYMEGALQSGARAARDIVKRWMVRCDGTIMAGTGVRRIQGDDYAVVKIGSLFPGSRPTIGSLARTMHLKSDLTLHALLGYRANAPAVKALYREEFQEEATDLALARQRLSEASTVFTASDDVFPEGTESPYVAWPVEPDDDAPIVLPLSAGFRGVMRDAVRERKRQTRLAAIQPQLDALDGELRAIRDKSEELEDTTKVFNAVTRDHAEDVLLLDALQGLVGMVLDKPKEPEDTRSGMGYMRQRERELLRDRLRTLRSEAREHLLVEPAEEFERRMGQRRDTESRDLLALVESPNFVRHVRTLAANADIVPAELFRNAIDQLLRAFRALLSSPQAGAAVDRHVRPMIDSLASRPLDLTGLSAPVTPGLDAAIRSAPPEPHATSALQILVAVGQYGPLLAGNSPGPASLAVGVVEWAAPLLFASVAESRGGSAVGLSGRLYRFLVQSASVRADAATGAPHPLSRAEQAALLEAIDTGNLRKLRDGMPWTRRFQTGPGWGIFIGLASAVCLMAAVQNDRAGTLERWSTIIGSGAGTLAGASMALQRYAVVSRFVQGGGGAALGVIGGLAGITSGALLAGEELQSGDSVGLGIAVAGTAGGVASVVGWLLAGGLASTGTGVGASWGVPMMIAGVVIGIGASVAAALREHFAEGSEKTFDPLLAYFGRSYGPYGRTQALRPSLRAAYEAVAAQEDKVEWLAVHPDCTPQLYDLGFGEALIAQIVDTTRADVQARLRQTERVAA